MRRYIDIMLAKIKQLAINTKGIATIEFVFSLPLLMIILYGVIEVARFELLNKTLDQAADGVANIVTQTSSVANLPSALAWTTGQANTIVEESKAAVGFPWFYLNGLVIVTDISANGGGAPTINWQYCGGGVTGLATSQIGSGTILNVEGEVVAVEVFYKYTPMLGMLPPMMLRKVSYYVPRFTSFVSYSSHC